MLEHAAQGGDHGLAEVSRYEAMLFSSAWLNRQGATRPCLSSAARS